MTSAHKFVTMFAVSFVIIVIAFVISATSDAFNASVYASEQNNANISLPGMTEDRYAPESKNIITLITDVIIPAMLPPTSGQGVCGIDIVCDSNGNAVK